MKVKNLIIGAGPAGLAMAGRLSKVGLPFEIIEQTDKIASKWHQHYDRLCLHTAKSLSCLPYQDFPEDYPQYVSRLQLVVYYENYAKQFNINPHFNTGAKAIYKKDNYWVVECTNDKIFEVENIIVATGLNRIPRIPTWKNQEKFEGEIIHASNYKNPNNFIGKKVLVVGMGNTGAEIALDLAEKNVAVGISVRSEIVVVPRDFLGKPVQLTAQKLEKLPFGIGDWIGQFSSKIKFGNLEKYGLPISKMKPAVLRRVVGKTPTIDLGTIAQIKSGKIKVHRGFEALTANGVAFKNGTTEIFDTLILATGYYCQINDFLENENNFLDKNGEPTAKIGVEKEKGLHFIGYEKYSLGGVLGTLKDDSQLILDTISIG